MLTLNNNNIKEKPMAGICIGDAFLYCKNIKL
jgi:hypothetical protein